MYITNYFGIYICPETNRIIYKSQTTSDVCFHCGFIKPDLDNHYKLLSVYEERYSLIEKIFMGKRDKLIVKDNPELIIVR